jgi:cytochrome c-type biogenesis protein CcmE
MGIHAHGRKGGGTVKAKHQRLILALAALSAVVGSGVLAMSGLKDRASYFYAPGDVARQGIPAGQIRLGGMVTNGSLVKAADGVTLSFIVHDEKSQVPVRFRGIPPDLFKEGSGVVAEGAFEGQTFVASNLLAKHDENYKPPQMAGNEHKTDTLKP